MSDGSLANDFREHLTSRLLRYHSAYVMDDGGRIYAPGTAPSEEAVATARALLRDERLVGPDRQFQSALEGFYRRPDADFLATVRDAITAVEGVARVALNDERVMLGSAINRMKEKHGLYGALTASIANLYGYASDEGGRHGLTDKPDIDRPIAELCLHQSAAAIVLIARLYGFGVVEGPQPAAGV